MEFLTTYFNFTFLNTTLDFGSSKIKVSLNICQEQQPVHGSIQPKIVSFAILLLKNKDLYQTLFLLMKTPLERPLINSNDIPTPLRRSDVIGEGSLLFDNGFSPKLKTKLP